MTDVKAELLPCPFCGSRPEESGEWPQLFEHSSECVTEYSVRCGRCGIEMGDEYRETAIAAWNTRPQPSPKVDGLVDELVAALKEASQISLDELFAWQIKTRPLLTKALAVQP